MSDRLKRFWKSRHTTITFPFWVRMIIHLSTATNRPIIQKWPFLNPVVEVKNVNNKWSHKSLYISDSMTIEGTKNKCYWRVSWRFLLSSSSENWFGVCHLSLACNRSENMKILHHKGLAGLRAPFFIAEWITESKSVFLSRCSSF